MDVNVEALLDKVREIAEKTSEAASLAADVAGKKASGFMSATKANLKIFDLSAECEVLYKEIGRMVYDLHQGVEVMNEAVEAKIAELDEKQGQIQELRRELDRNKPILVCPGCGKVCSPEDSFCSGCGVRL